MSLWHSLKVLGIVGTCQLALLRVFNTENVPGRLLSHLLHLQSLDRQRDGKTVGLIE
jgi:hypothetical protein